MLDPKHKRTEFLRHYLLLVVLAGLWLLFDNRHEINIWYKFYLILTFVAGLLFVLLKKIRFSCLERVTFTLPKGILVLITALLMSGLVVAFFVFPTGLFLTGSMRLMSSLLFAGFFAFLFTFQDEKTAPYLAFILIFTSLGVFYRIAAFVPEVQSSPFSLGWSEGSRIYNASLFFSEKVYGQKLPLPVLHPSRYLMQSIPFFFGTDSIFIHRLWQALLWIGMTAWGAWLLAKKLGKGLKVPIFWLSAFLFLFFMQGAVYYHLMVCVIIMLIGYRKGQPWRTLFFVFIASIWAGISRINWIPVPGLLAVSFYLIDEPLKNQNWFHYLRFPIIWSVIGIAAGWFAKQGYVLVSGEDASFFDSAFSSQLLWSRLFPNSTFVLGILPAILITVLPLLVLTLLYIRKNKELNIHWLRCLGLIGTLSVFFAGGVLVSLKIGGGGDLHNLDAFLVFFAVISLSLLSGKLTAEGDKNSVTPFSISLAPHFLLLLICFVPVWFAFMRSGNWRIQDKNETYSRLQSLQNAIDLVNQEPGEILFITERQLLTLGALEGVTIQPEYEKVFLMEMAMGNNQQYLQHFYDLLDQHYYKAIVMEPINTSIQQTWKSFAEENNAYVRNVILPLLMDYQLALSWDDGEINLLIPNGESELLQGLQSLSEP